MLFFAIKSGPAVLGAAKWLIWANKGAAITVGGVLVTGVYTIAKSVVDTAKTTFRK